MGPAAGRMKHYLDYAATSAIRPPAVLEAVSAYLRNVGATPGRGGHHLAVEAGRTALRCRRAVLDVLGLGGGDPGRFAFAMNATHALNTALSGVLGPGDAVVVTELDHNAVRRPVHALAHSRGVEVRLVRGAPDGSLDEQGYAAAVKGARLVVLNGASNVLGTALPVGRLASLAHQEDALVLVDAAQTAGALSQDLSGADLVAVTGHKGLLGPQGIGGLWVRPGLEIEPLLRGGTGGDSLDPLMPASMPERLEAGTLNGPAIAGLEAGCRFVLERGLEALHGEAMRLKARLWNGLQRIAGLEVLSPPGPAGTAIVTVRAAEVDPAALARRLDVEFGVQARSGLHCAPGAHRLLGTTETGALRFSLGWASTDDDVEWTVEAVSRILGPTPGGDPVGVRRSHATP